MSALAQPQQLNTSTDSVTSISVNARIDYILRFSKHAILVVDESAENCSSVGFKFIDQLSSEHNAAFISASPKLNNIQIRCRIIEQLFSASMFDPEQSLAVSVVNLLNANPQKLAIVIDNVQFASLQIMHELTQLALIAKKAKLAISVLMLGDYEAGKKLAENKELFNKKISILSKQSGQLLSLNAKTFKTTQSWSTLTVSRKWLIGIASISFIAIMAVVWLQQQGIFNFSKLPEVTKVELNDNESQMVLPTIFKNIDTKLTTESAAKPLVKFASTYDIYQVLTGQITIKKEQINKPADVSDIVTALVAFDSSSVKANSKAELEPSTQIQANNTHQIKESNADSSNNINPNTIVNSQIINTTKTSNENVVVIPISKEMPIAISALSLSPSPSPSPSPSEGKIASGEDYYKNFSKGFVIQISGFTQESMMREFLADHKDIEFEQYQRLLNDEVMTVLTSKHYVSHAKAERAMLALPETILARKPWIKSISAINNEINAFERSQ